MSSWSLLESDPAVFTELLEVRAFTVVAKHGFERGGGLLPFGFIRGPSQHARTGIPRFIAHEEAGLCRLLTACAPYALFLHPVAVVRIRRVRVHGRCLRRLIPARHQRQLLAHAQLAEHDPTDAYPCIPLRAAGVRREGCAA